MMDAQTTLGRALSTIDAYLHAETVSLVPTQVNTTSDASSGGSFSIPTNASSSNSDDHGPVISLRNPSQRDFARFPCGRLPNGKNPNLSVCIIQMVQKICLDLERNDNDTLDDTNRKIERINETNSRIGTFLGPAIAKLKLDIERDPELNNNISWGDVPKELKKKYINKFERTIKSTIGLDIDRCHDQWAAHRLLARYANNHLGERNSTNATTTTVTTVSTIVVIE